MQVYQQFGADVVPPTRSFIKNETPAQVFSCEFCEFFQSETLLKIKLWQRCFLINFEKFFSLQLHWKWDFATAVFWWTLRNFSSCNFDKNDTAPQVFSCKFWEIFHPLTSWKSKLNPRFIPVNFAKCLRTPWLWTIYKQLLLMYDYY